MDDMLQDLLLVALKSWANEGQELNLILSRNRPVYSKSKKISCAGFLLLNQC